MPYFYEYQAPEPVEAIAARLHELEREIQTKQCFQEAEALITRGLTEEETEMLRTLLGQVIHNLEEDRTV